MFKYILNITIKKIKTNNNNLTKKITFLKKEYKIKNINIFKTKNKNKIITLLRSPHIYKKSREQFIYKNFSLHFKISFKTFTQLLTFIFILQKVLIQNNYLNIKITKKCL